MCTGLREGAGPELVVIDATSGSGPFPGQFSKSLAGGTLVGALAADQADGVTRQAGHKGYRIKTVLGAGDGVRKDC